MSHHFNPIAVVRSCFKEKFGIPRQGALIPESKAIIAFLAPYDQPSILRGIESFSHLWILFVFHANAHKPNKTTVRPPRLGGNHRIGIFASRSGFRPNPIGLSLVKFERVSKEKGSLCLEVSGIDLLEGTPVLDIKPYLPWSDKPDMASAGFADQSPLQECSVRFSAQAENEMEKLPVEKEHHLKKLITQMLQNDPRPAIDHHRFDRKEYGACLYNWNICWVVEETGIRVTAIIPMKTCPLPAK